MKNIFKYLIYAATASIAAACVATPAEGPSEVVVASAGIDVSVSAVGDNSFILTLAPKGETLFYRYLLDEAEEPEVLDSVTFYKGGYTKLAGEQFKYSEMQTATVTLKDLKPGTSYVVYAVAGSKTGVPSSVVSKVVKTTDGGKPYIMELSAKKVDTVQLKFNEAVKLGKSVSINVDIYASASRDFLQTRKAYATHTVEAAAVKVEGDVAVIQLAKSMTVPAGAYVGVSFAENTFVDMNGNGCEANGPAFQLVDGEYEQVAALGRKPSVPFEMGEFRHDTLSIVTDINPFTISPDGIGYVEEEGELYANIDLRATGTIELSGIVDGRRFSETHPISVVNAAGNAIANFYYLRDTPQYGFFQFADIQPRCKDSVTVTISEGAYFDIFDNPSAEWTDSFVYYYDYKNFLGEWVVSGKDAEAPANDIETTMTLGKSDKASIQKWSSAESKYITYPINVMTLNWMGINCADEMYGYLDSSKGTLTFYPGNGEIATPDRYYYYQPSSGFIVIGAPMPGVLKGSSVDLGWKGFDYDGTGLGNKNLIIKKDTFEGTPLE